MKGASHDVLQGYFDDLLAPEPVQEVYDSPLPAYEAAVVTESEWAVEAEAQNLAREKLAKLLASSPLTVTASPEADGTSPLVELVAEQAITEPVVVETVTVEPVVTEQVAIEPAVPVAPDTAVQPAPAGPSLSDEQGCAVVDDAAEQPATEPLDDKTSKWLENGRPSWAQERFEVLLFEVAGLTLAVPLISLGQIQPLTDELTPLFGQAEWFMGLQPTPVGKIRTINTARFVMPERYEDKFVENAKYVVSIDGLPWGLAVDAVNQPITLQPEDVKWRGERSKRPWLAGTVKQHMCALLDIQTMGELLKSADQIKSPNDPLKG